MLVRLAVSMYIVFLTLSCLQFIYGSTGIKQNHQLKIYRNMLKENIRELEEFNEKLRFELKALRGNEEKIAINARSIGYFKNGEGLIWLGERPRVQQNQPTGWIVKRDASVHENLPLFRMISLSIGILAFLLMNFKNKNAYI